MERIKIGTSSNFKYVTSAAANTYGGPKHQDFVTLSSRISSFKDSKRTGVLPASLARAGFFYFGKHDHVYCYYCGLGLKQLSSTDNPWVEHALYSPNCAHLLLNKSRMEEIETIVRFICTFTRKCHPYCN